MGFGRAHLPPQVDVIIGVAALLFIVHGKVTAIRARKRAVAVDGVVVRSIPHARHTSYFVRYDYQGVQRVAEYYGLPLVPEYQDGQPLRILIDGTEPPDMQIPGMSSVAPGAQAGTCMLEGKPLFTLWDVVFTAATIALIVWRAREL